MHVSVAGWKSATGKQNQQVKVLRQALGGSVVQALIVNRGVAVTMMAVHVGKYNVDVLFLLVDIYFRIFISYVTSKRTTETRRGGFQ
jgi:hypothetical protein